MKGPMVVFVSLAVPFSTVGYLSPYRMLATESVGVALADVDVADVPSSSETAKLWTDVVVEVAFAVAAAAVELDAVRTQRSSSATRAGTEDIRTLAVAFAAVAGRKVDCWDPGFEMMPLKQVSSTEE